MELGTSPLPYETEVKVVSGRFCYCLRLTPCGQYSIESIEDDFLIFNQDIFDKWVYGHEISKDGIEHFHLVIFTVLDMDEMKQKVRDFIYPFFPDRGRGFGNKQYNLQYAKKPREAIAYCLKDCGESNFSGFTDECITALRGESYSKPSFDNDVKALNKRFIDTIMSDVDYLSEYYRIYSKYDRSINCHTINGYLLSIKVKKDPSYALELAKKNICYN